MKRTNVDTKGAHVWLDMSHTKSNCSLVALSYWHPRASVVVVVMMIIAQTLCWWCLKRLRLDKSIILHKVLKQIFFCPIWAIRNKCPVNICFSTRWTTCSLSLDLEWHLSLCHFLFDTPSPMRHSWWVLFAGTRDICLFSLFSKRICAKRKKSWKLENNIFFQQRNLLAILAKRESTTFFICFRNVNKFRLLIQTRIRINLVLTTLGNVLLTEDILKLI